MVTRAGVSESEFYQAFESAEDCFSAAFEEGLARLSEQVEQAAAREERWIGRVRSGLVALLGFLEDEPGWGRLLIVEAFIGPTAACEPARRVRGVLAGLMEERNGDAISGEKLAPSPALTAELVLGGVFSVIGARMCEPEASARALVELAPSLISFIAVVHLGQAAASAELAGGYAAADDASAWGVERLVAPPVPVSQRTTLVLSAIARAPRSSNREIAGAAGLGDEGQTSHLLRRLEQRGLIEKVRPRSGSRRENAWLLTPCGQRVIELLGLACAIDASASASTSVGEAA